VIAGHRDRAARGEGRRRACGFVDDGAAAGARVDDKDVAAGAVAGREFDAWLPKAMNRPPALMVAPRLEAALPAVPSASAETNLKIGREGSVTSTT